MRKIVSVCAVLLLCNVFLNAQATKKPSKVKSTAAVNQPLAKKKYPSLLWEISGNGLTKPSYLFGTMHVSNKLAFHLGDSFYNALKSVDVVALESNPETWQDDFGKSKLYGRAISSGTEPFADHITINSFSFDEYNEAIKAALAVEPSMINGMMYRSTGMDDFEEDTFLDMYIFRVGKKLAKKITGVENFAESEKLVAEAYRDLAKDQNKKRRSYDYEVGEPGNKKLEEAYRKGDLDLLDSLENLSVVSEAYQEKFLYKRNDIQANSIDTILKKQSLFVGVGAAHLAGPRGVIEQLRKKGYTVRPIIMDDRSSRQQETIEKIHSKLEFSPVAADDSSFSVAIPGKKFYRFADWGSMDVSQYADLENGAYYVVTRIKTNALLNGDSQAKVLKAVDSLLYENIPGKILKKNTIQKNGYQGIEVFNRTRRGDEQRYNIFVTPYEVLVFKMSGTADYIATGNEASQFFGSIQLKEIPQRNWTTVNNPSLGFKLSMPHEPFKLKEIDMGRSRIDFAASDKITGNSYFLLRMPIYDVTSIEEDSFELSLMEESYASSPFIEKTLSRKKIQKDNLPMLEVKYSHKDGSFSIARFCFAGAVHYVLVSRFRKEDEYVKQFFDSFTLLTPSFAEAQLYTDTSLKFTVKTNIVPTSKSRDFMEELREYYQGIGGLGESMDEVTEQQPRWSIIGNDSVGEKIFVVYKKAGPYDYQKDSSEVWSNIFGEFNYEFIDSAYLYTFDRVFDQPDGTKVRELHMTDTGSSKMVIRKVLLKNGHVLAVYCVTDTATKQSAFIENFFSSINFVDSLKGESIFTKKSEQFISDFLSADTLLSKKARRALGSVQFDSLDAPLLVKAIQTLSKKKPLEYLEHKEFFIRRLGFLNNPSVVPFLKKMYVEVKDTAELQHAILNAFTNIKTIESYSAFRESLLQEPPIVPESSSSGRYDISSDDYGAFLGGTPKNYGAYNNSRWPALYDSMALTKSLFPDLLQLAPLDDYKEDLFELLTEMVDSGYLKSSDYETVFSKLLFDAKQQIKKHLAKGEKEALKKDAEEEDANLALERYNLYGGRFGMPSPELSRSNILLMPFYEKNQAVRNYFEQVFKSRSEEVLYDVALIFLRNKRPVPDSLLLRFAKSDRFRIDLYEGLKDLNLLNKFPAAFKNQLAITKSLLINSGNRYESIDTAIYLDKLPVTYQGKKGYVYFYKYRRMRDDDSWQLAAIGIQPENQNEIDIENDEFTTTYLGKLEPDQDLKSQLQKHLRELLITKHKGAARFYDGRNSSMYKQYLSEAVKGERYRD